MTPDYMAYMLKYDTMHGRYDGTIEYDDNSITVAVSYTHLDVYKRQFLNGDMDEILDALIAADTAEKLKAQGERCV